MNLNKEILKELIEKISIEKNIDSFIIEKDYYVTLLLKQIVTRDNNFVFKGGTSLSKCHKVINRFSEDIDLNYDYNGTIPTKAKRYFINEVVEESAKKCGLILTNFKDIKKDNDYIKYNFSYSKLFGGMGYIKPEVEVETAFFLDSNPIEVKKANSIIGEYLLEKNRLDIIEKYGLNEFDVKVQSCIRTFIDKTIAICDYYYENRSNTTSRHLYDLYKLMPLIEFDDEFYNLFYSVYKNRIDKKIGQQYKLNTKISDQLNMIVETNFYKDDYNFNTLNICIEKITYEKVIENIKNIIIQLSKQNW